MIESAVCKHVDNWRALLTEQITGGQLLREARAEPLEFIPDAQTFRFEADVSFGPWSRGCWPPFNLFGAPGGTRYLRSVYRES